MTAPVVSIHVLPIVQARAIALAAQHNVAVPDLASVVESDPALTVALLRAANSAAQSPMHRVATVNDAIVRVGLLATRRIVTATATSAAFQQLARTGIDLDAFWGHTLATALLADASAWPNGPRTDAFTAGLLHDIGRLALATSDPDRYRFVVRRAQGGEPAEEAERALFGVDHITVGRQVATACELPAPIVEAIAAHHDGDGSALVWVTQHGRRLAGLIGFGDGIMPATPEVAIDGGPDEAIVRSLGGTVGIRTKGDCYGGLFAQQAAA